MKRFLIAVPLVVAACGNKPELTAAQQWNQMPESCHKILIATGPAPLAPKDWKPAETKKLQRYRSQLTDPSKDYVASKCGIRPGSTPEQS